MKVVIAFAIAWMIFLDSGLLAKQAPAGFPVWMGQVITKGAMLLLSLVAIRFLGPFNWSAAGFRWPENTHWRKVILPGLGLGAAATLAIRLSHSEGLAPMLKGYPFMAIVLVIWFGSSISEEIFARGWFQSYIASSTAYAPQLSALLFATLHLRLLRAGVEPRAVAILFIGTLLLGLLAGRFREESKSLLPAIAVHVAFNVGGLLGGIVSVLFEKLVLKGHTL